MAPRTIGALWRAAAWPPGQPAYLAEHEGGWVEVVPEEAARRVDELANGLLALGIRRGDAVAILGSTSLEWCLVDLALGLIGAISVPIYAASSPRECAHVLGDSEAVAVVAEGEEQLAKVQAERGQLPRLRHVLAFAELDELAGRGRGHASAHPTALAEAAAEVREDDLFTLMYTSGTTGPPKGCMIRHRHFVEMVRSIGALPGLLERGDTMLLYLPLAHTFGRLMHLVAPHAGYTLAFCADPARAPEALRAIRPTVFPSVPRAYEKAQAAVRERLDEARGPRRALARWALAVGREASRRRQAGEPLPWGLALRHRIADLLVYSKVKRRFGGRLRLAISGGAPLAREILEFFHALDLLILEGYGLTECTTACAVNRPERFRFGTVGLPLPGFEVALAEDGELLVRSETIFAGYQGDEEATRAALTADGWLRTGDVASIDEDGFIAIVDRKKDLIVTAGGKNVAPQNLERELKASPYVAEAFVVGDRRPYVAALIALDDEAVAAWRRRGGEDVEALVRSIVDAVNEHHSRAEQIKRFAVVPRPFSATEGEVTPTLKLRRRVVQEHFAREIEELYAGTAGVAQ